MTSLRDATQLSDLSDYQCPVAQIAADRIHNPKVPMREWLEGGRIQRDYIFEDARPVVRAVIREVPIVRIVRVLSPVPRPSYRIEWLTMLAWISAIAGCLVWAFCAGFFVRDHLASWLRLVIASVAHTTRAWLTIHG